MVRLVLSLEGSLSANISTVIMIIINDHDDGVGDAIDVNSGGGRDDLSEYRGCDHYGQNGYKMVTTFMMSYSG